MDALANSGSENKAAAEGEVYRTASNIILLEAAWTVTARFRNSIPIVLVSLQEVGIGMGSTAMGVSDDRVTEADDTSPFSDTLPLTSVSEIKVPCHMFRPITATYTYSLSANNVGESRVACMSTNGWGEALKFLVTDSPPNVAVREGGDEEAYWNIP